MSSGGVTHTAARFGPGSKGKAGAYGDISPGGEDLAALLQRQHVGPMPERVLVHWTKAPGARMRKPPEPFWLWRNRSWWVGWEWGKSPAGRNADNVTPSEAAEAIERQGSAFLSGYRLQAVQADERPVLAPEERRRQELLVAVRRAVWTRDGGQCLRCGSREQLEFDHIIPWADGGADSVENLQLLCRTCNRLKGRTVG